MIWGKVVWSNCYIKDTDKFLKINWQNTTLNLPNDYLKKLKKGMVFFGAFHKKKRQQNL